MEALMRFVEMFCRFDLEHVHKIGRRFYQAQPSLWILKEEIPRDAYAIGIFLGEEKKHFFPSLALLEMLAKKSDKKVFLNEKGEWLFTCKRDVFEENIVQKGVERGVCLVQNQHDENIGYGLLVFEKKKMLLKPLLDKGDFLRREH